MAAIFHSIDELSEMGAHALQQADKEGGLLDLAWLPYEVVLFVAVVACCCQGSDFFVGLGSLGAVVLVIVVVHNFLFFLFDFLGTLWTASVAPAIAVVTNPIVSLVASLYSAVCEPQPAGVPTSLVCAYPWATVFAALTLLSAIVIYATAPRDVCDREQRRTQQAPTSTG